MNNNDLNERVKSLRLALSSMVHSLNLQADLQLQNLPAPLRTLSMREFCQLYKADPKLYVQKTRPIVSNRTKRSRESIETAPVKRNAKKRAKQSLQKLDPRLPETPRFRHPLRSDSLFSVNGSPILNPFSDANGDNADTRDSISTGLFPPITTPIRMRGQSTILRRQTSSAISDNNAEKLGFNGYITLPLGEDGGELELDPTISPSALKGLGDDARQQVANQLAQLQSQLSSFMAQIQGC